MVIRANLFRLNGKSLGFWGSRSSSFHWPHWPMGTLTDAVIICGREQASLVRMETTNVRREGRWMAQAREEWFGRTSGIQASHWY